MAAFLGLTDRDVFDVVLTAAARCFLTKVVDGVGALPDAKYGALDPGLRDVLVVGRPIAQNGSEGSAPDASLASGR